MEQKLEMLEYSSFLSQLSWKKANMDKGYFSYDPLTILIYCNLWNVIKWTIRAIMQKTAERDLCVFKSGRKAW